MFTRMMFRFFILGLTIVLASSDATIESGDPVANVFWVHTGRYSYTYEKAIEVCKAKGAVLATFEQLKAAHAKGLDQCECGWTTERKAYYPITKSVGPRCGGPVPGIRSCTHEETYDAYCYKEPITDPCAKKPCGDFSTCHWVTGTKHFNCICQKGFKKVGSKCVYSPTCSFHYTPWNSLGGGNAIYLDRHSMSCGDSHAISYFHLEATALIMRYKFRCCSVQKDTCHFSSKPTPFNDDGKGNMVFLDRHAPTCGNRGFMRSIHLRRDSSGKRYRYDIGCCESKRPTSCYSENTGYTADGGGAVQFLDRQSVNCRADYFISRFHLNRSSDLKHVSYTYTCCKLA